MPWYVIQTGHQLCSCFRTSPSPNWDRRSSGQGCKPTQTQHGFSLLTLPASQKHPSPVCTQAASTALSAVRTVLSSPARLEPVCRSLPVARRRSQRPMPQHAPGLPGAIPLHELTASPQSGQIALILPDISSGQRLPSCCGQRCFLALTWCLWLSVSILKAIGTAQAVSCEICQLWLERPGSAGGSRCHVSAAAQVAHLSAEAGGEPQGTEREGGGRSTPDSPTQPWGD